MLASQRFEKIVELVNENGIVNTRELAKLLGVTETTIRRDCEELEQLGKLIRVHGGAKKVAQQNILSKSDEKEMRDRLGVNSREKDLVCKKAASFVKDGDCIFLDGGTTIAPMVKYLKGKKVKIVTHSLLVADAFHDSDAELILIGGRYVPEYSMSVGPLTDMYLDGFNFDHVFLGCAGYDLTKQVVYTTEMETMLIKRKVQDLGVKKYLLIDSSKLEVRGFYGYADGSKFDAVICNSSVLTDIEELPDNFIVVENE